MSDCKSDTTHRSLLTAHNLLLTTHNLQFTSYNSQLKRQPTFILRIICGTFRSYSPHYKTNKEMQPCDCISLLLIVFQKLTSLLRHTLLHIHLALDAVAVLVVEVCRAAGQLVGFVVFVPTQRIAVDIEIV